MVPTNRSAVVPVPPTPQAVVARATEQPALVAHLETAGDREDGAARGEDSAQNTRGRPQDSVPNRGGQAPQPARAVISTQDQHPDETANAPAVVARDDGDADQGPSVVGHGGTTSSGRPLQVQAAHEAVAPLTASDSRVSSDSRSTTGETAARTKAPQIISAKVQPTPTTPPGRRIGGDSNATDSAHPTAVPGHTSPSDPRGGGGTDTGRGGD